MKYYRPDIYDLLDTLSLGEKQELLVHLQNEIAAAKAAPKKSYLEEQWAEIKRLIEYLKYEPYIDDQLEIEEIWDICKEMIESGRLKDETWKTRRNVLKSIIGGEYYDYYGVSDPMEDLFKALQFKDEEKMECADIIFQIGSDYMKREGIKIYKELGRMDKCVDYLEGTLWRTAAPYVELIEYYKETNRSKALEIAELGFSKCKDDQTDIAVFLIQDAMEKGDEGRKAKYLKSAKMRRLVDYEKVREMLGI